MFRYIRNVTSNNVHSVYNINQTLISCHQPEEDPKMYRNVAPLNKKLMIMSAYAL